MENQSNQLNLTKDELSDMVKWIKVLFNFKLGELEFKSLIKSDSGIVFIFCDNQGKEYPKKLDDITIKIQTTSVPTNNPTVPSNNTTNIITETDLDLTSDVMPMTGGAVFSETSDVIHSYKKKSSKHKHKNYNNEMFSETSSVQPEKDYFRGGGLNQDSDIYSQTSPMPKENKNLFMKGGNFKSKANPNDVFSETSPFVSMNQNEMLSVTSSINPNFGMRGGSMMSATSSDMPTTNKYNFSDTSPVNPTNSTNSTNSNMKGGNRSSSDVFSPTSQMPNSIRPTQTIQQMRGGNRSSSDVFSPTSQMPNMTMMGGRLNQTGTTETSDVNFSDTNLDTNIFRKSSSQKQKGGSVGVNNGLKNQMRDMGIGSTSTSSVCE